MKSSLAFYSNPISITSSVVLAIKGENYLKRVNLRFGPCILFYFIQQNPNKKIGNF